MLCNKADGVAVALQITLSIALGTGALAQHVIGKRERIARFFSRRLGLFHGLNHGLAQHKLPP